MACIAFAVLNRQLACSPISNLLVIVQVTCLALESNLPGKKEKKLFSGKSCVGFEFLEVISVQFFFYLPLPSIPPIMNTGRITSRYVDM